MVFDWQPHASRTGEMKSNCQNPPLLKHEEEGEEEEEAEDTCNKLNSKHCRFQTASVLLEGRGGEH